MQQQKRTRSCTLLRYLWGVEVCGGVQRCGGVRRCGSWPSWGSWVWQVWTEAQSCKRTTFRLPATVPLPAPPCNALNLDVGQQLLASLPCAALLLLLLEWLCGQRQLSAVVQCMG